MSKEIVVDGVRYVPASTCGGPIKIAVIERGFIYVGRIDGSDPFGADSTTIHGARSLIRWGSSQHIGELVNGPLENTKLGASCTVHVGKKQIIHFIEVNQDAWTKHIDS
jgi:hypothetical protein